MCHFVLGLPWLTADQVLSALTKVLSALPTTAQVRKEDGKTPVLSLGWVELPPINITGKTDLRKFYLILLTTKTKKLKMLSVTFLPCLFPGSTVLHPQLLYLLYFEQAGAVGWVLGWYYLANFALNFQGYVF